MTKNAKVTLTFRGPVPETFKQWVDSLIDLAEMHPCFLSSTVTLPKEEPR